MIRSLKAEREGSQSWSFTAFRILYLWTTLSQSFVQIQIPLVCSIDYCNVTAVCHATFPKQYHRIHVAPSGNGAAENTAPQHTVEQPPRHWGFVSHLLCQWWACRSWWCCFRGRTWFSPCTPPRRPARRCTRWQTHPVLEKFVWDTNWRRCENAADLL